MKYVYGIICHRLTSPLEFLVSEISKNPDVIILIHIDAKANATPFFDLFSKNEKVHILSKRENVLWGGYSQIQATLNLLAYAKNFDYQYFTFLSGDDIPLQKIENYHNFLKNNPYEYLDIEFKPDHNIYTRVKNKHPECFFQKHRSKKQIWLCKLFKLMFKLGLYKNDLTNIPPLIKGSSWFSLSQDAIQYIFDYLDQHPQYTEVFKTSLCGDEIFFHSILYNSEFKSRIKTTGNKSESYVRYIDWFTGPDYPRTLVEEDFTAMKNSGLYFARKVQSDLSLEMLNHHFGSK